MFNKELINKNSYALKIIWFYTIMLSAVYGYMTYVFSDKIWAFVLVSVSIIIAGIVTTIIYLNKQNNKITLDEKTKELNK